MQPAEYSWGDSWVVYIPDWFDADGPAAYQSETQRNNVLVYNYISHGHAVVLAVIRLY